MLVACWLLAATFQTASIKLPDGPTLIVHYDASCVWTPGMPKLCMIDNGERVTEVRADDKPIVTFDYRADRYIGAVSVPGHFTLRLTPPDAQHHVRQTLMTETGRVLNETDVISTADGQGMWHRNAYEGVAQALGFDPRSLTWQNDPDANLRTARDARGRVALYVAWIGRDFVGFTPDGVPRYYDLTADIWDTDIQPGHDVGTSRSFEQNKAAPARVTFTSDGMPGVYIDEPANGAIYAVWVEKDGHGGTVTKYARGTTEH